MSIIISAHGPNNIIAVCATENRWLGIERIRVRRYYYYWLPGDWPSRNKRADTNKTVRINKSNLYHSFCLSYTSYAIQLRRGTTTHSFDPPAAVSSVRRDECSAQFSHTIVVLSSNERRDTLSRLYLRDVYSFSEKARAFRMSFLRTTLRLFCIKLYYIVVQYAFNGKHSIYMSKTSVVVRRFVLCRKHSSICFKY